MEGMEGMELEGRKGRPTNKQADGQIDKQATCAPRSSRRLGVGVA